MKLFYKFAVVLIAVALIFVVAGCSNDEKALVDAVKNGDTAKVQSLLDKGANPNLKTDDGKTVLMLAAYLGHTDIAKLLIDKGADVNATDKDGKTALMYAAEKGNLDVAQLLLNKGADINAVDNNGKTALQIAKDNNQTPMVDFLNNWGKPAPTAAPTATPVPTSTAIPTETPTPAPVQTPTPGATPAPVTNANQKLTSIFFDFDKALLRSDQTGVMRDNLTKLMDNQNMYIILGGNADERGTREFNMALSEQRAQAIQKYLIDNGIAPDKITIYAFGKEYPLKKGHDEASRSYNRRVDILEWNTTLTREEFINKIIK